MNDKRLPSKDEQLAAREEIIYKIDDLGRKLNINSEKRQDQLKHFGTSGGGFIVHSLFREALVYQATLDRVTNDLLLKFRKYFDDPRTTENATAYRLRRESDERAFRTLKDCVRIMRPYELGKYVKLLKVIASTGATVTGLSIPFQIGALIGAADKIKDVMEIPHGDEVEATKFLLELEMFMFGAMSTMHWAAIVWEIASKPVKQIGGNIEATRAQEYVTRQMLDVRKELLKNDQKPLLRFPENGLWATDVLAMIS